MRKINQKIRDAVETAIVSKTDGRCKFRKAVVTWSKDDIAVCYYGNQVFEYDKRTGGWWINNCGWPTAKTREKVEACMEAVSLPYRYFLKKGEQWLRNIDTGMTWKCGDGRITPQDIEFNGL